MMTTIGVANPNRWKAHGSGLTDLAGAVHSRSSRLETASTQRKKDLSQRSALSEDSAAVLLFFHQFMHICIQIIVHSTISRLPAVYIVRPLLYVSSSEKPHTMVYFQHLVLFRLLSNRILLARKHWQPSQQHSPHHRVSAIPCTCASHPMGHHHLQRIQMPQPHAQPHLLHAPID